MATQGNIKISNGCVFRWVIQESISPEVYGWVEKNFDIIKESSGWFRTADPILASKIAQSNIETGRLNIA
jgi:hypothetical protein